MKKKKQRRSLALLPQAIRIQRSLAKKKKGEEEEHVKEKALK